MSADSRPSLNIIENEVENAKEGAITPVVELNCEVLQILFPYQE